MCDFQGRSWNIKKRFNISAYEAFCGQWCLEVKLSLISHSGMCEVANILSIKDITTQEILEAIRDQEGGHNQSFEPIAYRSGSIPALDDTERSHLHGEQEWI